MLSEKKFNLKLEDEIKGAYLVLTNIPEDYFWGGDEKKAEAIVNFYTQNNLPRKVYYIYYFDLTTTSIGKGRETVMGYTNSIKLFVQEAIVKKIQVFADRGYQVKLGVIDMATTTK